MHRLDMLASVAALAAVTSPALAVEPTGKFERATTTNWSSFTASSPAAVASVIGSTQRIIDLHVDQASPLLFSGATVSETEAPYATAWWWYYSQTAAQVGSLFAANSARLTNLKGYVVSGQTYYAAVMVDNTGSNARAWSWFPDTTLSALSTWLAANPDRVIDMSTWLDGSGTRHYAAVTISNTGSDQITIPTGLPQWLDQQTPQQIQTYLANHVKARVIDLEPEGSGTSLAVLAYDGVHGNLASNNAHAVAPDNWYFPALDVTGTGPLPEQYVPHITRMLGARVVSVAADGGLYDGAFLADQPLPAPDPQPSPNNDSTNQFAYLDTRMETFMRQYGVTGTGIAIAKGGKLVYARGYGYADTEQGAGLQAKPSTLFRVGSISKLITTVSVLKMIEQGKKTESGHTFSLSTPIFNEVLRPFFSQSGGATGNLASIAMGDVLTHTAGYLDDDIQSVADPHGLCIGNPLTATACIAGVLHLSSTPTCQDLMSKWMLTTQPTSAPGGASGYYDNWDWCEAQTVIDAISGAASYADYFTTNFVHPMNPNNLDLFAPASDTYTPSTTEARDYAPTPWATVPNQLVPSVPAQVDSPYGGVPMFPGLAAGAWKASPIALVKLATLIDQSTSTGQLLGASSFAEMWSGSWVVASGDNPGFQYGLGVEINPRNGDVYKDGLVSGGAGFVVFKNLIDTYSHNSCANCIVWAALINTADPGSSVDASDGLNSSMIDALEQTSVLDAINASSVDMFPAYGLPAGN